MKQFLVRAAKITDMCSIWEIRQNSQNRIHFHTQNDFTLNEHISWFTKQYLQETKNYCFVLDYQSQAIGYCRFDKQKEFFFVSIALLPNFQKKGHGSYLLTQSLKFLDSPFQVRAEVKKSNLESLNLFKKNHFQIKNETEQIYSLVFES